MLSFDNILNQNLPPLHAIIVYVLVFVNVQFVTYPAKNTLQRSKAISTHDASLLKSNLANSVNTY